MRVGVIWAVFAVDISGLLSACIIIFTSSFWSNVDDCAVTLDFSDWITHNWAVSITVGRLIGSFSLWNTNIGFHASIKHLLSITEFVRLFTCQLAMLFIAVFSLMSGFLCFTSWWFRADMLMLKITFNWAISWAKLVIVANGSFNTCIVFFASIFISSSWTFDLSFGTCGFAPYWTKRSVISGCLTFTSFWDAEIVSDTIRPYTDWEIFFAALNLVFVTQVW